MFMAIPSEKSELGWVKSLSICSMFYIASAVPAMLAARAKVRQVIDIEVKMACAAGLPRGACGS
jgi:hypothetical protein